MAAAHLYSGAPPWGGVLCDGDPPPIMQSCFAGDENIYDDYGGSDDDVYVNDDDDDDDLQLFRAEFEKSGNLGTQFLVHFQLKFRK